MDLYLVRHAAAFDPDHAKWPTDRDRPLTPEGEKRFRRAARGLVSLVSSVDVMLSSSYRRAWQTAELLAAAGWPAPLESEALEAGSTPAAVLHAVEAFGGVASVALVGHEPTMHELVSYLLTAETGHAHVEFGKGAVARLEVDGVLRPGAARLRWMLAPRVLRAIGG
jgi:phosphohistidine phosphatase